MSFIGQYGNHLYLPQRKTYFWPIVTIAYWTIEAFTQQPTTSLATLSITQDPLNSHDWSIQFICFTFKVLNIVSTFSIPDCSNTDPALIDQLWIENMTNKKKHLFKFSFRQIFTNVCPLFIIRKCLIMCRQKIFDYQF